MLQNGIKSLLDLGVEFQSLNKVRDELNAGQLQLKRAIETIDRETEVLDR